MKPATVRHLRLLTLFLPLVAAVALQSACAQAPVVDRSPGSSQNSGSRGGSSAGTAQTELFTQLQELQREVRSLRGKVEEQGHLIQRLDSKRLQDYRNLDKRISDLQKHGGGQSASAPASNLGVGTNVPVTITSGGIRQSEGSRQELDDYRAAYELLKDQKIEQAEKAFEKFVQQHRDSQYAGNGYYWLGKLRLIDGATEKARDAFEHLVSKYPGNRKVPDATFELAKLYFQAGNRDQSKKLLDKVINDYSNVAATTAELARAYRNKYYQ